jgi:hypothetical protein
VPKSYGTVKGQIKFEGSPPKKELISMGANEGACHAGAPEDENYDQTYLISSSGGVKNVIVILQPGEGKFFQMPEDQMKEKDVKIEQPRCAFIPRVFSLFCQRWDPKTAAYKATSNKLIILNNAPFQHNFNMSAGMEQGGQNFTLASGQSKELKNFLPEAQPLMTKCDIHNWMRCYGFFLDHPYAAVTDENGNFTIENAPLGVDVQVVCWHEGPKFFGEGGIKGKKMTLQDGQTLELPKLKR